MRFDTLPLDAEGIAASPEALHALIRAHDRVRNGEMPPKDAEQPQPEARSALVAALARTIEAGEAHAVNGTGRATIRRLNRIEYEHTLRDLLSLPSLQVKDLLPADARRENFDKLAGGLDISYVQMAKYLEAATTALDQAVVPAAEPPKKTVWREAAMDQDTARSAINQKMLVPINGREIAPGYATTMNGDPVNDRNNAYIWASFDGKADSAAVLKSTSSPSGSPPATGSRSIR